MKRRKADQGLADSIDGESRDGFGGTDATGRSALERLRVAGDGRPYLFVQALLADPNRSGTEAARLAGYSEKGAAVHATRLLKRAKVRAALAEGRMQLAEKFEINQEKVTQELAALAFSRLDHVFDIDDETGVWTLKPGKHIPNNTRKALKKVRITTTRRIRDDEAPIEEQRVEVEMHSKDGALDKLMAHLGLYPRATQPKPPGEIVVQLVAAVIDAPSESHVLRR